MWANDPEMAKKWEKEENMKKETKVRQLIKKMVREIMKEDFAGSYPPHTRKKFDNMRRKQSEVLGYTLTGKDDLKSEIDDATINTKAGDRYVAEGKLTEKVNTLPPFEIAKRMMKSKYWKKVGPNFYKQVIKKFIELKAKSCNIPY